MPYFVFVATNAVLVKKNRWTFRVYKNAFPSGGRGTAIAVDEVFPRAETPHPSAFGRHLLPQEKAIYNSAQSEQKGQKAYSPLSSCR